MLPCGKTARPLLSLGIDLALECAPGNVTLCDLCFCSHTKVAMTHVHIMCLSVQMYQHLDEFVIGQERAKKVLSVAMYNHYKRLNASLSASQQQGENEEYMEHINVRPPIGMRKFAQVISFQIWDVTAVAGCGFSIRVWLQHQGVAAAPGCGMWLQHQGVATASGYGWDVGV